MTNRRVALAVSRPGGIQTVETGRQATAAGSHRCAEEGNEAAVQTVQAGSLGARGEKACKIVCARGGVTNALCGCAQCEVTVTEATVEAGKEATAEGSKGVAVKAAFLISVHCGCKGCMGHAGL